MTDTIPQRPLGKTGASISAIGMGGHHLGDCASVDEAITLVHAAIDAGINFFDNCWEYHNGKSEDILGRALAGKRDKVFLMTKVCTHGRDAGLALKMLEQSLRRLQTDHLDLWQVHGVTFDDDPDRAAMKGGVFEALDQAKKQGKVRFVGFTGHKDPSIHLKMLATGYAFDTVQMPLNCFDASFRSFENQVLPVLNQKQLGAIGMKAMTGRAWPITKGVVTGEEMLRYAMSLPVSTTVTGIDSAARLDQALRVARGFTPLSNAEMQKLRDRCKPMALDGRFEPYKVSIAYDNPQARIAHEYPLDAKTKETKELLDFAAGTPSSQK